jgi:hypothetical protein
MKAVTFRVLKILFLISLVYIAGCGQLLERHGWSSKSNSDPDKLSVYTSFAPEKVYIMPLTEFVNTDNIRRISVKPYVCLLDSFGSQVKSPCVFRFELYQRALRSAEPKGKRVDIWKDIDLTELAVNNEYWRDFLRAYEFDLPFEHDINQSYILQVTCMCPNDRRLSDEFALKLNP